MRGQNTDIEVLHLLLGVIHNVDVGLVVIDRDYQISTWNGFMENHSGLSPSAVIGKELFALFPELPVEWLRNKLDNIFLLNNRSFSTWQQRPYLIRFDSYRPITGRTEVMYQNMTLFPLTSITGSVDHICLMLYDASDAAMDELALKEANKQLDQLSRIDGLTGLYNRKTWDEHLDSEYLRFSRSAHPTTLIMLDIDHFKRVNDNYGHPAGDEVIRQVSHMIQEEKRETDIAGRYGGEEFGLILLDSDREGAVAFCERLRHRVEVTPVSHDDASIEFTISLGIAELSADIDGSQRWLQQADQALYRSKEGGRNRATLFST